MFSKLKKFLLVNTSTKQTIVKNTFWLLLAEWVSKWSLFLISILIARQLWPEQFGVMSFVMSFVGMFIVLTDFWLTTLMVREVSRDQSKLWEYFVNGNFLKVILGIITFLVVWWVSQFIGKPDFYMSLILIYCGYAIVNNIGEFIRSFFRPSEHMQYEAVLKIVNGILVILVIWWALWMWYGLQGIFYAYLISGVISLVISMWFVIGRKAINSLKIKRSVLISSIRSWFLLWLWSLFITVYISTDQIILSYFDTMHNVWIYAFAYRISLIYSFVFGLLMYTLLPNISKKNTIQNVKENYKKWLKKLWLVNFIFFIVIELLTFVIYRYKIIGMWEYSASLVILMLLFVYTFFEPLCNRWYINMISIWKEKKMMFFFLLTALINLIWNLIVIPIYWYYWATATTILSYICLFFMIRKYLYRMST